MTPPLRPATLGPDEVDLADIAARRFAAGPDGPAAGSELGWFGVGIPEGLGGSGGTLRELAVLIDAGGAAATASCLAVEAGVVADLLTAGDAPAHALLGRLVSGQLRVAVPAASPWQLDILVDGDHISGELVCFGGQDAELVIVPAVLPTGQAVVVVPTAHPSVAAQALDATDVTRTFSQISLSRMPAADAVLVVTQDDVFRRLFTRMGLILALDSVGAARTALARTLEYAAVRHQFGRAIGSFQAYKHRCATAFLEFSLAQSLAYRAAVPREARHAVLAAAAGRLATANAAFVCGEAVQLHGGIGFTWEAGLHALLKRTKVNQIVASGGAAGVDLLLEMAREEDVA